MTADNIQRLQRSLQSPTPHEEQIVASPTMEAFLSSSSPEALDSLMDEIFNESGEGPREFENNQQPIDPRGSKATMMQTVAEDPLPELLLDELMEKQSCEGPQAVNNNQWFPAGNKTSDGPDIQQRPTMMQQPVIQTYAMPRNEPSASHNVAPLLCQSRRRDECIPSPTMD